MSLDRDKSAKAVSKLLTAARTVSPTLFKAEIARILGEENPNAETLLDVIAKIGPVAPGDAHTALHRADELLLPHLQVRLGLEQIAASRKMSISANWLAFGAIFFGSIQAIFGALSYLLPAACK